MTKTLDEIRMSEKPLLTAADIAPVLQSDPQAIRIAAREGKLGIPAICVGSRVKFPREPFLRVMGNESKM